MKKLIVLALLSLVFAVLFFAYSCTDDTSEDQTPDTTTPSVDTDYSDLFIQTREDTELSFFSYFGREGFDSYILSFPAEWLEKEWAEEIDKDRSGFFKKVEAGIENLAKDRISDYGDTFEVAYNHILDEKIEGEDFEALKAELKAYGVSTDNVTEAVRAHYSIAYFSDVEKTKMLSESSLIITLFYIDKEGWFVSPDNYIPVEF